MGKSKINYITPVIDKTGNVWFNAAHAMVRVPRTTGNTVIPHSNKTKKANVHPYTIAL